jgi:hypothetical protein
MYALYIPWRAYARLKKIPQALVKRDLETGRLRIHSNDRGTHQRLYAMVPGRLLSMHARYVHGSGRWLTRSREFDTSNMEIMVDSGAFSAWNKEEPDNIDVRPLLDLYRWVDRLAGNRFKDVRYISLDVIPGVPGRKPTHDEIKEPVRRSDENHRVLQDVFGDRVLPVFHQGEHPDRLAELMEINPTYIGISPQNQLFEELRRHWARNVHDQLRSKIMTHGLATTGGTMMELIDWRSVDSTTWVLQAAMGKIRFEWESQLIDLGISEGSSTRYKLGEHFDTLVDDRKLKLIDEICDKLDITPHMLRKRDTYRYLFNAHTMTERSKRLRARDKLVFKGV